MSPNHIAQIISTGISIGPHKKFSVPCDHHTYYLMLPNSLLKVLVTLFALYTILLTFTVKLCPYFKKESLLPNPIKICFVCLGNIVRSPLAENLFRHLVENSGLNEKYEADFAGTSGWHVGEAPDRRMRQVALSHGLRYTGSSRQFKPQDFDKFDLIIAMDSSNLKSLLGMTRTPEQQAKVHMMRSFDPLASPNDPVPDPYYGGIDGFEDVYMLVERSCQGLLDTLEAGEIV